MPAASAERYLAQVLSRYRNARSYRDSGQVVLRVEKEGRRIRQVAPMQVALDGSTIWIAAYDARLWSDAKRTLGWIANEKTRYYDGQVVVGGSQEEQAKVGRPTLDYLLRDPILTERMVAGLGGPPPQLEWLLDPDPMARLFHEDESELHSKRVLDYDGISIRDDIACVIVRATVDGDVYRFWVDRERSLIHSVDLPVSIAGKNVQLDGWIVHSLELHLKGARFDRPDPPLSIEHVQHADLPPRPRYVQAMVPRPPPRPNARLGSPIGAFDGKDITGQINVTHLGAGREFTLFFAGEHDDNTSAAFNNFAAASHLVGWFNAAAPAIQERVQIVALADRESETMFSETGMLVLRDTDGDVCERVGLQEGQSGLVDSNGTLIWVGTPSVAGDVAIYSPVIEDAIKGVDVPKRMRKRSRLEQAAYHDRLEKVTVNPVTTGP